MRDEAYIESQRPRRMFAKILNDSRMFFAVARQTWDEAGRLLRERKEEEDRRPVNETSMGDDVDSLIVRAESALTVAMMNYTTSIELLMKAFLGIRRRFDEESLRQMRGKVNHESEKVLDHIPREWREKLEEIYQATEMSQIEIFPFYNSWNPPSDWIEDTTRLDTTTLQKFLVFLSKERLNRDRYSFEKFAEDDWRIKISSYDKIIQFHEEVEKFLIEKAKEKGCRSTSIIVTLTPAKEDKKSRFFKLSFPTPQDAFNFDKETFGRKGVNDIIPSLIAA